MTPDVPETIPRQEPRESLVEAPFVDGGVHRQNRLNGVVGVSPLHHPQSYELVLG